MILNTKQYQLSPGITAEDVAEGSPDHDRLAKTMESTRAPADLRGEEGGTKTSVSKNKPSLDLCANKDCQVIRGRVLTLEGEFLVVKENSGKEVGMKVDRKTQKG